MSRAAAYFATLYSLLGARFEDRKDRGATAVEYGLMVGLIAVAIIALVALLGDQLAALFTEVTDELAESSGITENTPS